MEFEASTRTQETTFSFGYQMELPEAKMVFKGKEGIALIVQCITNCSNYTGNTGTDFFFFDISFHCFLLILWDSSYSDMQNKIFKLCFLILNTLFAWFTNPFCSLNAHNLLKTR